MISLKTTKYVWFCISCIKLYIYWTKSYSMNEAISTHNYCEQAVIRLYYIGTECNNTENTS